jgi:omega-6 fatty acid desaturase (delta-12 desaturase)
MAQNQYRSPIAQDSAVTTATAAAQTVERETVTVPSVKEIRANFDERARAKSTFKGLLLFSISMTVYILGYWAFIVVQGWPLKILSAAVFTMAIPMLFVIGHDACHQALTPRSLLNKILGRLAMLPAWHAYSVWDYGHNGLHHGWTNLKGKDHVWPPYSKAEYDALSPFWQWMNRRYRTWWGVGLYYIVEMWLIFGMSKAKVKTAATNRLFWYDRLSIVATTLLQAILFTFVADRTNLGSHWWLVTTGLLTLGIVIPFLLWNWLMGCLIFQHHTHPKVPWYGNVKDYTFFAGQIQSVVHVEMPKPIELILHNIMEHTAHHVDPRIPLYNLENAQKDLENAYAPGDLIVFPFTIGGYLNSLRTCRLFDYENFRWLDWDGRPTTEPLLSRDTATGKLAKI